MGRTRTLVGDKTGRRSLRDTWRLVYYLGDCHRRHYCCSIRKGPDRRINGLPQQNHGRRTFKYLDPTSYRNLISIVKTSTIEHRGGESHWILCVYPLLPRYDTVDTVSYGRKCRDFPGHPSLQTPIITPPLGRGVFCTGVLFWIDTLVTRSIPH